MSYTMYTPLNVWLDPASVTDVVAYIQNYLSENTIYSEEEIEELIHDYLIAHPELIGGVQSVNGKTGTVVLTASDINTTNNTTIQAVINSLSADISAIVQSVTNEATARSNADTELSGRITTNATGITNEATARANADTALGNRITALQGAVGSPLVASTASAMTETSKIYVYTGSEIGYTNGNWYYYNGSAWTSGGVYNATAINTDTTLTVAGMAADAKATGDGLNDLKSSIDNGYYEASEYVSGSHNIRLTIDTNAARCTTKTYYYLSVGDSIEVINIPANYKFVIAGANNNTLVYDSGWKTTNYKYTISESYVGYYFVNFAKSNGTDAINPSEITAGTRIIKNNKINDNTEKINEIVNHYSYDVPAIVGSSVWNVYQHGLYSVSNGAYGDYPGYICSVYPLNVSGGDSLTLFDFPSNSTFLYVLYYNNGTYLSNYNATITGTTFYLNVPANCNKVHFNISFGADEYTENVKLPNVILNKKTSLKSSVNDLLVNSGYEQLPAYWSNYLSTKFNGLREYSGQACNGDSFAFFTDYHLKNNACNTPNIIRTLIANTELSFAVHGGDVITQETTLDEALKTLSDYNKQFSNINLFNVIGNHDQNNPSTSEHDYELTNNQSYSMLCKKQESKYIDTNGFDYCFDNKAQKIRYIVIGSQKQSWIVTSQVRWFCSQLLEVPNGYSVFVFSHLGATSDGVNGNFTPILDAMIALHNKQSYHYSVNDYDYSNKDVVVIGGMSGHVHYDCSYVTEEGFPIIGTMTDAVSESHPNTTMTAGTTTEQAIDVVRIDKTERKIYCTRIGAGENRTFTY